VTKKILAVSYDESLLRTRKMILEREGFAVSAASGLEEATRACADATPFDLILLGHSIPRGEKEKMLAELKRHCRAPILSIRSHADPPVPGADYSVDSHDGPEALISAVKQVLNG
jgi:DNA-binding NtrC family response regulator